MPIYEYQCDCGDRKEALLSIQDADQPQVCECGKVMQRKVSLSSLRMKQTGNQMALNTLNDKRNGMPNRWWRPGAEKAAFAGTQSKTKTVF
jgi:putative FmdB family regulatory protein